MASTSTQSLVHLAAAGDRDAFTALVSSHVGIVRAISLAIVGSPPSSDDVAQEVFLEAWKRLPDLRNEASFTPWIRQITRYRSHDLVRKAARRNKRVVLDETALATAVDPARAEEVLLQAAEQAALDDAMAALDSDDREALFLFYREGQSSKQVAHMLDVSEPAVRKRISRARKCLRADVEARLSKGLKRTTSGAAVVAAVVALVAATPARAQSPLSRALPGGLAAIAIALFLVGMRGCASTPMPGSVPTPAVASGHATPIATAAVEVAEDSQTDPEPTLVTMQMGFSDTVEPFSLGVGGRDFGAFRKGHHYSPDAPWPDTEVGHSYREYLLDGNRAPFEEAAADARLDCDVDPNDDPYLALMAISHAADTRLFEAEAAMSLLPESEQEAVQFAAGDCLALAEVLMGAADARVAEYGTVAAMGLFGNYQADIGDAIIGMELSLNVLDTTEEPALQMEALYALMTLNGPPFSVMNDHRWRVLDGIETDSMGINRYSVLQFAFRQALYERNETRAASVSRQMEVLKQEYCEDSGPRGYCEMMTVESYQMRAHVAMESGATPDGWQARLVVAGHACHGRHPVIPTVSITGQVEPDYSWEWDGPLSNWHLCVQDAVASVGLPPNTALKIWVLGESPARIRRMIYGTELRPVQDSRNTNSLSDR